MDQGNLRIPIGEILIDKGLLDRSYLSFALDVQRTCGLPLGEILIANNLVTERDVYGAIAEQSKCDFLESIALSEIDLPGEDGSSEFQESLRVMKENLIIPLKDGRLAVTNPVGIEKFFVFTGVRTVVVATPTAILTAIETIFLRYYETVVMAAHKQYDDETIADTVGTFLDAILRKAIIARASDIHFEIEMPSCVVRFRIDGDLYHQMTYDIRLHTHIANIIVMRALGHPSNNQHFDDGAFEFSLTDKVRAFFRLSKLPTIPGAAICLRVIRQDSMLMALDKIGFLDNQIAMLQRFMKRPHGVILLAGPTGSRKSTTLYSLVNELRGTATKIISVEDPIEVNINFITQVQVNRDAGIDFGTAIRSFMRHDPDVILVGEIRDKETAKMAIEASMTGHLVLSSIHANNVFDVFTRLMDLDVSYRKMTAIEGIVSQRLVKKRCGCDSDKGCERCGGSGFMGRVVISEILGLTNEMRSYLYKEDVTGFIQCAIDKGFKTIETIALEYIDQGITTRNEVEKWIALDSEEE